MENTTDELLKFTIQKSSEIFLQNGYNDEDSLNNWLGQSLFQLYQTGSSAGFSRESNSALEGIKKDDILNFLVNNYVEKIKDTDDANIRDDFQSIIKAKAKTEGIDTVQNVLKDYIEKGSLDGFDETSREEVAKYKPESLVQAMGIITAKKVLNDDKVNVSDLKQANSKGFLASDFAVISTGTYDIDKIVGLMEGIRSGRISSTKDENKVVEDNEER